MHEPWQPGPRAEPERAAEHRQGFLEARLASSRRVWLRDVHRAAQARGLRATGLSIAAVLLFLMGLGTWGGSWLTGDRPGAWLGAFYMLPSVLLLAWHLHRERRPGWRRRRRP